MTFDQNILNETRKALGQLYADDDSVQGLIVTFYKLSSDDAKLYIAESKKPNGSSTPNEAKAAESAPQTPPSAALPLPMVPVNDKPGETVDPNGDPETATKQVAPSVGATTVPINEPFIDPLPDVPTFLKSLNNWVRWKLETGNNGRLTKVPYQVNGYKASSTNSKTWADYRTVVTGTAINSETGVGFVLNDGIVGFDLDNCLNPETHAITPWADEIIEALGSYTEITPSGTGLRVLVRGHLPEGADNVFSLDPAVGFGGNKVVKIETYETGRYFTVTGDSLYEDPGDIEEYDVAEAIKLLDKIRTEHPAPKKEKGQVIDGQPGSSVQVEREFDALATDKLTVLMKGTVKSSVPFVIDYCGNSLEFPSHSEADMSLATVLAIKHGDNAALIDEDFRKSPLYRAKWDREDYRANTIATAIISGLKVRAQIEAEQLSESVDNHYTAPTDSVVDSDMENQYTLTAEEYEAEMEKEHPVIPLATPGGPTWDDEIMYGFLGDVVRKACASSEAHPGGVYTDLIVSVGNIFGRTAFFSVDAKHHYTNEYFVRVGRTSRARKGTARSIVDNILQMVDPDWYARRVTSGFGSAEAIVYEIRDASQQRVSVKKHGEISYQNVLVPGVDDKRLCIREDEITGTFQLAAKSESRADVVLRDGWDGTPLRNKVKGQNQNGISNSAVCMEPHISISGDTTRNELLKRLPEGFENSGFGNRFMWCYVQRLKKCPMGSPVLNWAKEAEYLNSVVVFAKGVRYMPLSRNAARMFKSFYMDPSLELSGLAGKMTDRAIPHIRRIAMILALVDKSTIVDSCHVKAARALWDYFQESAQYIFTGTTKEQNRILDWVRKQALLGSVTSTSIVQQLYQKHKTAEWVRAQVAELVRMGKLVDNNGQITPVK